MMLKCCKRLPMRYVKLEKYEEEEEVQRGGGFYGMQDTTKEIPGKQTGAGFLFVVSCSLGLVRDNALSRASFSCFLAREEKNGPLSYARRKSLLWMD